MIAVVTGGSRGIGKGIAQALLEKGFTVIVTARSKGTEIQEFEKAYDGKVLFVPCDISKEEDRKNLVSFVKENFGKLDLLVNNAGVAPRERKDILEITPEDFDYLMDINLKVHFSLLRSLLPCLLKVKNPES